MNKYIIKDRKKIGAIEAMQYTGHNAFRIRQWSNNLVYESPVLEPTEDNPKGVYLQIKAYHSGRLTFFNAIPGTWIVKANDDEFYPIPDYLFELIYAPLENKNFLSVLA